MDTLSSVESNSFEVPPVFLPNEDIFETDWTLWFPTYCRGCINTIPCLKSQPYNKKLRLVEAIIFASVVAYLIVCAAIPSFNVQSSLAN